MVDVGGATEPVDRAPLVHRLDTQARWRIGTIVVAAIVLVVAGLFASRSQGQRAMAFAALDGSVTMPPAILVDTDGERFDLREETAGRMTLLFFGYLSCPDACPIQMAVLGAAFGDLPSDVRDRYTVVFVTTDPARDSPEDLRTYLDRFDPSFVGLTGSSDELRDAQFAAGVPAATANEPDADGDYLVGHATQVLLFDPDGIARRAYGLGVRQADWVDDLKTLAREVEP